MNSKSDSILRAFNSSGTISELCYELRYITSVLHSMDINPLPLYRNKSPIPVMYGEKGVEDAIYFFKDSEGSLHCRIVTDGVEIASV
jgi:hypothetical protein